ncbi:MAG: MerR family transcriptional regulator [Eubacterium sp.]|jgi:DNA-binding transcriptional MerR regulator|nr:MerR family transcriptional regulator [Eubacterium sp.]
MNIKEVELLTQISKQNIRFYEKKGLLHPKRNEENSYREYSPEDVERLKQIKIFRKLDVSLENIQKILDGEDMNTILKEHLHLLEEKQNELDAAIQMCNFLLQTQTDSIDTEAILSRIENIERKGGHFMSIVYDYKKIAKAESKRKFSFQPDTMVMNSEEFKEALEKYGEENNLNLIVTQEGMYPKFEIDGLEYEANRQFFRYGAVICCELTHPEMLKDEYRDIDEKRSRKLRNFYRACNVLALPIALFLFFAITRGNLLFAGLLTIMELPFLWFTFRNFRMK